MGLTTTRPVDQIDGNCDGSERQYGHHGDGECRKGCRDRAQMTRLLCRCADPIDIGRYHMLCGNRTTSAVASNAKRGVDKAVDIPCAESDLSNSHFPAQPGLNRGQNRLSRQEARSQS